MKNQKKIDAYFATKKELDVIRDEATLAKWKVLSVAYKLGKEIWGNKFSVSQLAKDMGLPYTTTKRCLALDKATPKSLALMNAKKISAFKLAMICMTRDNHFQDEMVEEVILGNLSTYDIKHFKPKKLKDIKNWEKSQAARMENRRKTKAYNIFNSWIDKGYLLLLTPISSVSKEKQKILITNLKRLHKKIGAYIKKNNQVVNSIPKSSPRASGGATAA